MRVAIIGGGGAAHLLSVLLSGRGHCVRVLTSKPTQWRQTLELETEKGVLLGKIEFASSEPKQVLDGAEVAFLCMPVHQYPFALDRIMPFLAENPSCIVGTVYGQAGFDWMVKNAARKIRVAVPNHFAIGLLPWIVRTQVYGHRSISYGPKLRNGIATSNQEVFESLQSRILDDLSYSYWGCGRFERVPNFLTLTLTVDNQIIHPSRCFALVGESDGWASEKDVPFFYKDWDDYSAEILKGIDDDFKAVRHALFERYPQLKNPYDLDYLELEHWSYGSHNADIKASFVNSTTLGHIKPPIVKSADGKYRLDSNHRFFKDDFAYGLEICKWFADVLGCKIDNVSRLIAWYRQEIVQKQHTQIGAGTPTTYGLDIDDVVL